jgi:hypothetical protein
MESTVHVIATTLDGTRAALSAAVPLARGSDAALMVLVPRIAPAGDNGGEADPAALFAKRYEEMAGQLGALVTIDICTCESVDQLMARICASRGIVVLGGPAGHWLTSPEERFANRLARAGCRVIFAPSGENTTQRRVGFRSEAA